MASNTTTTSKLTKGRQKIKMKMIENEDDRLITFSKRRSGIYKKASELATLCGAEVGVLVFSQSGKAFTFGHPSIESIANRFLCGQNPHSSSDDSMHLLIESHRRLRVAELNQQHNELISQLDAEIERGKALRRMTEGQGSSDKGWWEAPVEELDMQDLNQMNSMLEDLHQTLSNKITEKRKVGFGGGPST